MRDLAGDADFAVEARQRSAILHELFRQELQRDILIELQVFRTINLAHAPAANESNNAISVCKQRAGENAATFGAQ